MASQVLTVPIKLKMIVIVSVWLNLEEQIFC